LQVFSGVLEQFWSDTVSWCHCSDSYGISTVVE